ncbi:MAG TPA: response regulator transcription factor [Candidatus Coprovivens excrementavium]|nr:response regulator transcription factor [Candidatus Coprovivens excrementavium]
MTKILIVDDEQDIAQLINDVLKDEGFDTVIKNDGYAAIEEVKNNHFDLILLDIMMPNISGTETCNKIRDLVSCPIIFVTAKNQTIDKLLGFEIGADDYITKPFVIEELVARVKAHIRRENRANISPSNIIKIGDIEINKESYEAKKKGEPVVLSTKEFELLSYLMSNAGVVLSKEQIYNAVWKTEYGDIGTVAVNIKSLRKKLDPEEKYIITIWGLGYKFVKVINND